MHTPYVASQIVSEMLFVSVCAEILLNSDHEQLCIFVVVKSSFWGDSLKDLDDLYNIKCPTKS